MAACVVHGDFAVGSTGISGCMVVTAFGYGLLCAIRVGFRHHSCPEVTAIGNAAPARACAGWVVAVAAAA